jgi:hypothetical protein
MVYLHAVVRPDGWAGKARGGVRMFVLP